MARPKSTGPIKQKLHVTISAQSRMNLEFVAKQTGQSISVVIEELAAKEAKRLSRATGAEIPNAEQMTLADLKED